MNDSYTLPVVWRMPHSHVRFAETNQVSFPDVFLHADFASLLSGVAVPFAVTARCSCRSALILFKRTNRGVIPTGAKRSGGTCCSFHP